jgi:hypothetical protein
MQLEIAPTDKAAQYVLGVMLRCFWFLSSFVIRKPKTLSNYLRYVYLPSRRLTAHVIVQIGRQPERYLAIPLLGTTALIHRAIRVL